MQRILGSPVTDQAWTQSQLPVSMSGLGLRIAQEHACSAYLGSIHVTVDVVREALRMLELQVDIPAVLAHYSEMAGSQEPLAREEVLGQRQKLMSYRVDSVKRESFIDSLVRLRDKARISSVSQKH